MYRLHYAPDSASLVVRVLLGELGQPFEESLLDRAAGMHDSPDYRRLHPLGLVPAFETPDGPMFETTAILLWLADRHGAMAPAPQSPDRANFLKWLFFTNTSIHTTLLQLFYPDRVAGAAAVPQVLTSARERMALYLSLLEQEVSTNPPWASVSQPTLLGHYVGLLLRWLQYGPQDKPSHFPLGDYPSLQRMLSGLERRPAALAAGQAEGLGARLYTNPDNKG
jgi:glutathione S-transferase